MDERPLDVTTRAGRSESRDPTGEIVERVNDAAILIESTEMPIASDQASVVQQFVDGYIRWEWREVRVEEGLHCHLSSVAERRWRSVRGTCFAICIEKIAQESHIVVFDG